MNIHAQIDILRHQNRYTETQNCKKYRGLRKHSQIYRHTLTHTVRHTKITTSTWGDIDTENLCSTPKTDIQMYRNIKVI